MMQLDELYLVQTLVRLLLEHLLLIGAMCVCVCVVWGGRLHCNMRLRQQVVPLHCLPPHGEALADTLLHTAVVCCWQMTGKCPWRWSAGGCQLSLGLLGVETSAVK